LVSAPHALPFFVVLPTVCLLSVPHLLPFLVVLPSVCLLSAPRALPFLVVIPSVCLVSAPHTLPFLVVLPSVCLLSVPHALPFLVVLPSVCLVSSPHALPFIVGRLYAFFLALTDLYVINNLRMFHNLSTLLMIRSKRCFEEKRLRSAHIKTSWRYRYTVMTKACIFEDQSCAIVYFIGFLFICCRYKAIGTKRILCWCRNAKWKRMLSLYFFK
jgi:hypothetical protein